MMDQAIGPLYLDIYRNHTWPIQTFNFDHHWKTVTESSEWDSCVRLVRNYDVQEYLPEKDYIRLFLFDHPICFMFPVSFLGVLTGFGFRSVDSHDFSIRKWGPTISYTSSRMLKMSPDFKFQYPLVISEGVADAEAISQMYPWSVGALGNCVRRLVARMLPLVTNKVYLMLDNDEGGSTGRGKMRSILRGTIDVEVIEYPKEYKDPAEYFIADQNGMRERLSFLGHQ